MAYSQSQAIANVKWASNSITGSDSLNHFQIFHILLKNSLLTIIRPIEGEIDYMAELPLTASIE